MSTRCIKTRKKLKREEPVPKDHLLSHHRRSLETKKMTRTLPQSRQALFPAQEKRAKKPLKDPLQKGEVANAESKETNKSSNQKAMRNSIIYKKIFPTNICFRFQKTMILMIQI